MEIHIPDEQIFSFFCLYLNKNDVWSILCYNSYIQHQINSQEKLREALNCEKNSPVNAGRIISEKAQQRVSELQHLTNGRICL